MHFIFHDLQIESSKEQHLNLLYHCILIFKSNVVSFYLLISFLKESLCCLRRF